MDKPNSQESEDSIASFQRGKVEGLRFFIENARLFMGGSSGALLLIAAFLSAPPKYLLVKILVADAMAMFLYSLYVAIKQYQGLSAETATILGYSPKEFASLDKEWEEIGGRILGILEFREDMEHAFTWGVSLMVAIALIVNFFGK